MMDKRGERRRGVLERTAQRQERSAGKQVRFAQRQDRQTAEMLRYTRQIRWMTVTVTIATIVNVVIAYLTYCATQP